MPISPPFASPWPRSCCSASCRASRAATLDAIEYYNSALDHYFVTASADEIAKLDAGFFVGWQRTTLGFKVFEPADATAGALAVCRFYGNPLAGLDSHFYSASADECADVARKFPLAWLLESDNVFRVFLPEPVTGQCPANSVAVYRSWNNRADSNHRYTTDTGVHDAMIARGYVAEGYGPGPRPVAMCAPLPPGSVVPACTLSPSSSSAVAGATVLLNAFCTGSPTSYAWTNCTSTGPQCSASSPNAGGVTYTVVASNAAGAGAPASTTVTWTTPPPPPPPENRPVCSIVVTSQNPSPVGRLAARPAELLHRQSHELPMDRMRELEQQLPGAVVGGRACHVHARREQLGGLERPRERQRHLDRNGRPARRRMRAVSQRAVHGRGHRERRRLHALQRAARVRLERRVGGALHGAAHGHRRARSARCRSRSSAARPRSAT